MSDRSLGEKLIWAMIDGDQPVYSAKDLAEEFGYTRQHIDSKLRSLHNTGRVEMIEVGPGVGWYVDYPGITEIEKELTGRSIMRYTSVVPCRACPEQLGDGDNAILLFEQVGGSGTDWEVIDGVCADHLDQERDITSLFDGMESYIQDGIYNTNMCFAFAEGKLWVDNDHTHRYLRLGKAKLRQLHHSPPEEDRLENIASVQ